MKNKILFTTSILLVALCLKVSGQARVCGVLTNEIGEFIPFANIMLYQNGQLITGAQTDFDGYYSFDNVMSGSYELEAFYLGYKCKRSFLTVIDVDLQMDMALDELEYICGGCYDIVPPMIHFDAFTQGHTIKINNNGTISQSNAFVRD